MKRILIGTIKIFCGASAIFMAVVIADLMHDTYLAKSELTRNLDIFGSKSTEFANCFNNGKKGCDLPEWVDRLPARNVASVFKKSFGRRLRTVSYRVEIKAVSRHELSIFFFNKQIIAEVYTVAEFEKNPKVTELLTYNYSAGATPELVKYNISEE